VAVIGSQTYRRVQLVMEGRIETFAIVFQPGGLSHLSSVPAEAMTNQHFDGRAVLGCSVDELRSRLGESTSFAQRVGVMDNYLLRLMAQSTHIDVVPVARDLLRRRGCVRIAAMAERAGLSVRQFERRFIAEIGVAPKLYARVARFEAALKSKMQFPDRRWTDVAHELGYHDQMHMVHDFRELSGSTPSDVAPRVELFVTPEIDGTR
jgi:AraC-like DNA-binding protein